MFRVSGAHHQEYLKTGTAATGTCVMVAGRSSHHHIWDENICPQGRTYPINAVAMVKNRITTPIDHACMKLYDS